MTLKCTSMNEKGTYDQLITPTSAQNQPLASEWCAMRFRKFGKCGTAGKWLGATAVFLTFLPHSRSETLAEPAVPALVPLVLVHHTLPVKPTDRPTNKQTSCNNNKIMW